MKAVKMRVTENQSSEAIQNCLFAHGYKWSSLGTEFNDVSIGIGDGFYGHTDGSMGFDYQRDFDRFEAQEIFFAHKGDDFVEVPADAPVVSDGGSSSYYQLTITNKAGETINCETGDILRALVGNDYDLSNIVKACRRMYEASQGRGKVGASIEYDANKVKYFVDEFQHWNKQ